MPRSSAGASTSSSGDSRSGRALATMRPIASRAPSTARATTSCSPPASSRTRRRDARGEPQGAEVAQLGAGDADLPVAATQAGDVEPQHQRSRRSVRQGPAARVCRQPQGPGTPRRRRRPGRRARPETTSRPAGATSARERRASAIRVSARRFATTRSKRARTAATPPASSVHAGSAVSCQVRARQRQHRAIDVERDDTRHAEPRERRGEHARARADVERRRAPRRSRPPPRSPRGTCASSRAGPCRTPCRARSPAPRGPAPPGRPTAARRAGASPIASGRWWSRKTASQSSAGRRLGRDARAPRRPARSARGCASQRAQRPGQRRVAIRRRHVRLERRWARSRPARAVRLADAGHEGGDALVGQEARDGVGQRAPRPRAAPRASRRRGRSLAAAAHRGAIGEAVGGRQSNRSPVDAAVRRLAYARRHGGGGDRASRRERHVPGEHAAGLPPRGGARRAT